MVIMHVWCTGAGGALWRNYRQKVTSLCFFCLVGTRWKDSGVKLSGICGLAGLRIQGLEHLAVEVFSVGGWLIHGYGGSR